MKNRGEDNVQFGFQQEKLDLFSHNLLRMLIILNLYTINYQIIIKNISIVL
jgi:hypothetical protein